MEIALILVSLVLMVYAGRDLYKSFRKPRRIEQWRVQVRGQKVENLVDHKTRNRIEGVVIVNLVRGKEELHLYYADPRKPDFEKSLNKAVADAEERAIAMNVHMLER